MINIIYFQLFVLTLVQNNIKNFFFSTICNAKQEK